MAQFKQQLESDPRDEETTRYTSKTKQTANTQPGNEGSIICSRKKNEEGNKINYCQNSNRVSYKSVRVSLINRVVYFNRKVWGLPSGYQKLMCGNSPAQRNSRRNSKTRTAPPISKAHFRQPRRESSSTRAISIHHTERYEDASHNLLISCFGESSFYNP